MYNFDVTYIFVIMGGLISLGAQSLVTGRYNKYKKVSSDKKKTGAMVARMILDSNGLSNVEVRKVDGNLTDHYDPTKKTVNLSNDIYSGNSIASIAVAAHECGHAIQYKDGYLFLRIRHSLVPIVNISTNLGYIVVMIGLAASMFNLAMIGMLLLGMILIFQLVTLPVEFNASTRGKKQLQKLKISTNKDDKGVKDMLFAAALTYVAALTSSILQILRLLLIVLSSRRDD